MRSKPHTLALIMKKCISLKLDKNIDAFCEFNAHVNEVGVSVYRSWGDSSPIYSASTLISSGWNPNHNSKSIDQILEDLDAIYLGLGIE